MDFSLISLSRCRDVLREYGALDVSFLPGIESLPGRAVADMRALLVDIEVDAQGFWNACFHFFPADSDSNRLAAWNAARRGCPLAFIPAFFSEKMCLAWEDRSEEQGLMASLFNLSLHRPV